MIIQFPWQTSPRSEIRRRFLQPLQLLLPALTFRRATLEYGGRLRQDEREGTACSSRRVCYRQIIRVNDMVNVRAMIFCQLPFVPYLIRRTQELRQGFAQATGAANQSPNRPISARASRLVNAGRDDLQAVCMYRTQAPISERSRCVMLLGVSQQTDRNLYGKLGSVGGEECDHAT